MLSSKRMAICAQRLKKSKKYPKHWKYIIEVEEVDGTISTIPAYGTDMEDALASVSLIAKRSWLMRFFNRIPQWVAFVIIGIITTGAAVLSEYFATPNWIVGLLGVTCLTGGVFYFFNKSVEQHMIKSNE